MKDNWVKYRLADLCEIIIGKTPSRSNPDFWGEGYPWTSISDLKEKEITFTKEKITQEAVSKCRCRAIKKGTLLFSFKLSIGKIALAGTDLFTNEAIAALPIFRTDLVVSEYLYYALQHNKSPSGNLVARGETLNKKSLEKINIWAPKNISDQIRIANFLSRVEELTEKRREGLRLLDELVKSRFREMFGDPVQNEKGWNVTKLGKLGNWKSGGTPSRKFAHYFAGDIPWVTSGELNELYVSDSKEKITREALIASNAQLIPEDSLLLGMYDTAALKSSISKGSISCNQAVAFAKLDADLCEVVFVYFLIQIGKKHFKRQQRGVRQKNLNLSMVEALAIISPPKPLQTQFTDFVTKIESLKAKYTASLAALEQLYASASQRAFQGKLDLSAMDVSEELLRHETAVAQEVPAAPAPAEAIGEAISRLYRQITDTVKPLLQFAEKQSKIQAKIADIFSITEILQRSQPLQKQYLTHFKAIGPSLAAYQKAHQTWAASVAQWSGQIYTFEEFWQEETTPENYEARKTEMYQWLRKGILMQEFDVEKRIMRFRVNHLQTQPTQ